MSYTCSGSLGICTYERYKWLRSFQRFLRSMSTWVLSNALSILIITSISLALESMLQWLDKPFPSLRTSDNITIFHINYLPLIISSNCGLVYTYLLMELSSHITTSCNTTLISQTKVIGERNICLATWCALRIDGVFEEKLSSYLLVLFQYVTWHHMTSLRAQILT